MAFRNLSSSETGSEQFEVAVISKQLYVFASSQAGLTQQHAQREKRSC